MRVFAVSVHPHPAPCDRVVRLVGVVNAKPKVGQLNRQHKMHHEIVVGSQQPVASNFLHSSPAIPRFGCSLPVCLVSQLMKAQGKELCVSGPVRACVLSAVEIYNQGKERKVILYPVPTQYCKVRYSTVQYS